MHGQRIRGQTRGGPNRYSPPATDGLAPEPDCLTMYAILYGQQRFRPPFADFRVNLRDGTIGVFRCQRERPSINTIDTNQLLAYAFDSYPLVPQYTGGKATRHL